jgi:hypothetical protein
MITTETTESTEKNSLFSVPSVVNDNVVNKNCKVWPRPVSRAQLWVNSTLGRVDLADRASYTPVYVRTMVHPRYSLCRVIFEPGALCMPTSLHGQWAGYGC